MAATRTQIYLRQDQRHRLDQLGKARGESLADLIRQAVDAYLDDVVPDVDQALRHTFGTAPDFEVPGRSEWDRGYG